MYEETCRSQLHSRTHNHPVLYNPVEPVDWPEKSKRLVDLTMDVVGDQAILVEHPKEMVKWLNEANLISLDSQVMGAALTRAGVRTTKVVVPFGHNVMGSLTQTQVINRIGVGLLNHSFAAHINSKAFEYLLDGLGVDEHPVLSFGNYGGDYDPIVSDTGKLTFVEDLADFAGKLHILLLPAHIGALVSLTLPMSLMLSGCAVICSRQSAYYELQGQGVFKVDNNPRSWQETLLSLATKPQLLINLMQANHKAATVTSTQSIIRLRQAVSK